MGYASYVIGYDHLRRDIREFKVERIERATLLETVYETRGGFDPYNFLEHSWGIMGGDEVVDVVLRFSARVAYRVRESDWPGVVDVTDEPDGGCRMRFRVKHTLEMKPWIRGWGPECEVLAPEELRREIAADMIEAGRCMNREDLSARTHDAFVELNGHKRRTSWRSPKLLHGIPRASETGKMTVSGALASSTAVAFCNTRERGGRILPVATSRLADLSPLLAPTDWLLLSCPVFSPRRRRCSLPAFLDSFTACPAVR